MSGIRLEQSQDIDEILLDCKLASVLNIHQDICNKGLFIRTIRACVYRVKTCLSIEFPTTMTADFLQLAQLLLSHILLLDKEPILNDIFNIIINYSIRFKDLSKGDPIRISLIGLIILLITASMPLKYNHLSEFVDAYPEFISIDQYELAKLMQNANLMHAAITVLVPSQNKGIIMNIVPRLAEGPNVKYITGGGSSERTTNRVLLFEREGNITVKKRSLCIKKTTSLKNNRKKSNEDESYLTLSSFPCSSSTLVKCSFDEEDMVLEQASSVSSEFYKLGSSISSSSSYCSSNNSNSRANSFSKDLYGSIPFLIDINKIHWHQYDDLENEYNETNDIKRQKINTEIINSTTLANSELNESTNWDILLNVVKSFY